jgi:D-amino peptidase
MPGDFSIVLFRRIMIIADIEGSSGCWSYTASSFFRREWALACAAMTLDVQAVVQALLNAGVEEIVVKDFHRTGYNLLPEQIDPRARVDQGYVTGPIPAMGNPGGAEAAIFLGLHAASGTSGFLAHTMTSRLAEVEVNGRCLPEITLFSALLAPFGIRPVFFSGCPVACRQAEAEIPGVTTFAIDKGIDLQSFDVQDWRDGLVRTAVKALSNGDTRPLIGEGPHAVRVVFRDGTVAARTVARRWRLTQEGASVRFAVQDMKALFLMLSRICYLTPGMIPLLPAVLWLQNLKGRLGLSWVRRQLRKGVSVS